MSSAPFFAWLGLALVSASVQCASPYAGQESREIKALSSDDVRALVTGQGMGFAKAAELNGFPGPAHVLELAETLALTAEQLEKTRAIFASMSEKASALGKTLVQRELELDRLFASKSITAERLTVALRELGILQAEVRMAHLEAHLAQIRILTPEQTNRYAQLRGYGSGDPQRSHKHKH